MEKNEKIILFILHNLSAISQEITTDSVVNNLELMRLHIYDIEGILATLENQGYVMKYHNKLALTDKGTEEAQIISKIKIEEEFIDFIDRASSSEAYRNYCEEIYGYRISMFNMMDKTQLDFLFNNISISKNDSIVDLGCGNGCILNFLMQKYECRGIGIDQLSSEIFKKYNGLATYIDGSLDELEFYNICPSITIAVDSLYFCNEIDRLLNTLTNFKGNRLYLYYSQYIFDEKLEDRDILKYNNTTLARNLNRLGVNYKTIDYSENERSLYERGVRVLPKYKDAFDREGNKDLYDKKINENIFGKGLYDNGCASRFLYIIE